MGRNNYFTFKQFTVIQEYSAMKVGVDGVLLGAWTNPGTAENILDAGTGTGLLALMLAQKSNARITALEIDEFAAKEALQNVKSSPWSGQIEIIHDSLQHYAAETTTRFGLIVSNPPYFQNSSRPGDERRKKARHNDELPLADLAACSKNLLRENGILSVILPDDVAPEFIRLAGNINLFLTRTTWVRHNPDRPYHRRLLEFSNQQKPLDETYLTIQVENVFTEEYKKITGDYYLTF